MSGEPEAGVDLSGAHAELDKLKAQLCRCQHQGKPDLDPFRSPHPPAFKKQ